MKFSKEAVEKSGGYTGGPCKKEVEWTNVETGEKVSADVWIRPLSYFSLITDAKAISSDNQDNLVASRIASSVCDEDGWPIFTVADITGLNDDGTPVMADDGAPRGALSSELTGALYNLVYEVSGLGKRKKN